MKLKIASMLLVALMASMSSINAMAANTAIKSGKQYHALAADSGVGGANINCYLNASDVCISNQSSQSVNFDVAYPYPSNSVAGPLNPPAWVDAYSTYVFNSVYVTITNSYGQPIFQQYVSNHSVINIGDNLAATAGKNPLKITVHNG